MKFIDETEVHDRLSYPELVAALRDGHMRDVEQVRSTVLEQTGATGTTNHFLAGPTWQHDRAVGTKLVTVFPENEHNGSGLPSVQAVYVLFDGQNGRPVACIDGTALTLRKTAADSALGAQFLAPPTPERMLMVGAGAMAPHLIMAHLSVRPGIRSIGIWNRTPERAEMLAASMDLPGVTVRAVADIERAAREADIISCATMAHDPLIFGEWLKPGAHLDLVGSYMPAMHECDETAVRLASVFVDSRWSAVEDCGEIVSALESGALTKRAILADNFQLVRGEHPGRTGPSEITLYKNGGGGHLDLMVAQFLCDGA